ncbi:NADPH:quinone reductase [Vibrio nigripulchritudo]|uniref:NADP-dependent oxidoreductase n=1 Tax=Vibrio nigripulchritudo TaxID=28173 RepID=UPI00190DBC24|nr:NADP-dependent oxidoreductase [Vibrio nigripulchritudo]BCL69453.1 NADPH:quinone reductase [Vibrio nigripulchritudo]BDU30793.1 NADPH:quinone reductase [Vibrio nigripulchritudo]
MKAAYIEQYGNTEKLIVGDIAKPQIQPDQVLIKVHGAGVNPVDWLVREGLVRDITDHKLPLILGWDAAGEIAQIGEQVTDFQLGDEVFVYAPISDQGAYAEYIAVDSDIVARKPDSLTTLTAAAVPLAAATAWQALMQGCQLQSGDKVLIHNASGGVGSFAVQIAKAHGAYVIGTASAAKEPYVRALGVDEFIDYRSQCFEDSVEQVDAVLAAVGGDDVLTRSLKVIRPGGYLISLLDELDDEMAQQQGIHYQRWFVTPNANDLQQISELIDSGKVQVHIEKIFKLDQVKQAHSLSESKRTTGKIIIDLSA